MKSPLDEVYKAIALLLCSGMEKAWPRLAFESYKYYTDIVNKVVEGHIITLFNCSIVSISPEHIFLTCIKSRIHHSSQVGQTTLETKPCPACVWENACMCLEPFIGLMSLLSHAHFVKTYIHCAW